MIFGKFDLKVNVDKTERTVICSHSDRLDQDQDASRRKTRKIGSFLDVLMRI